MLFRAVLVPFTAVILAGSALALPTGVQYSSGGGMIKNRDNGSSGSMQGGHGPMNMSDPSSGMGNSTTFPHPNGPGPMNSTMPSSMHNGHKNMTMPLANSTVPMNMTDPSSMSPANSTGSSGSCSGTVTVTVTAYLPGPTGSAGAMPANSSSQMTPSSTMAGTPLTTSMPIVGQNPNSTMNPNMTTNSNMTLPGTNATFPLSVNVTAIAEQQAEEAASELANLLQRRRTLGVRRRIAVY